MTIEVIRKQISSLYGNASYSAIMMIQKELEKKMHENRKSSQVYFERRHMNPEADRRYKRHKEIAEEIERALLAFEDYSKKECKQLKLQFYM